MRKDTMDLGGVTPLIIREFGDGSVKEFTVQLVEKKSIFLKSLTWGTLQKERIEELVYQTCMTFWINILRPLLKQVAENIYLDKLLKSKEFVNFSELVSGIA